MSFLTTLSKKQKETIGLLQIGTFLEYFDLMLYVHMGVLLNELFFPKTDPYTASLLAAFAFSSTFVLRPFGSLLFGYIGDNFGRKATVILTTMLMAISCVVMANMPTYAQIGIAAAWAVTICRAIQGLSSMGEIVAAEIYLTELIPNPAKYPAVALMSCSSAFGTMMALGVSMLVLDLGLEWRVAFWLGATIAVVGTVARTRLRETPEFLQTKYRKQVYSKPSIDFGSVVAFFLIYCAWPACFYFAYVHCAHILKHQYAYSSQAIINQNFVVSIVQCVSYLLYALLSYRIQPLKILRLKVVIIIPFFLVCPLLLEYSTSGLWIFVIQSFVMLFAMTAAPAMPIFINVFPVLRRFTYTGLIYALTRAIMYVATSFGLVYITQYFGSWGIALMMVPLALGFLWGTRYFEGKKDAFA